MNMDLRSRIIERFPITHHAFETLATKTVSRHRHTVWYYLGGLTLLFFIVQIITGVLLLLYYKPTVEEAHASVSYIIESVPYGWLVRAIHSWSANAMIATLFLHMTTTYFLRSYRKPREMMWVSGWVLMLVALGFGFTGYLLPWDEVAYFATAIGTEVPRILPFVGEFASNLVRGTQGDVGQTTLSRLFTAHVIILPLVALAIVLLHVVMILFQGTSTPLGAVEKKPARPFFFNFALRDLSMWCVALAALTALAGFFPPALGKAFDISAPTAPPAGIHPEWYFMSLFQSLKLGPELVVFILSNIVIILLVAVPWLDRKAKRAEKSALQRWSGILLIGYIIVTTVMGYIGAARERALAEISSHELVAKTFIDPDVPIDRKSGLIVAVGIFLFAAGSFYVAAVLLDRKKNID